MNEVYKGTINNLNSFMQQLRSLSLSDEDKAVKLYDKHGRKLDLAFRKVLSELSVDIGKAYASTTARKPNERSREVFGTKSSVSAENVYVEDGDYDYDAVPPRQAQRRRSPNRQNLMPRRLDDYPNDGDFDGEVPYGVAAGQGLLPPSDFAGGAPGPGQSENVMSGPLEVLGGNLDGEVGALLDPDTRLNMGSSPINHEADSRDLLPEPVRELTIDADGNVQYP